MTIGSRAPWTDHEKNVCSRESATISSLVMATGAVVMPMGHLGASLGRPWPGHVVRPWRWPRHWLMITAQRRASGDPTRVSGGADDLLHRGCRRRGPAAGEPFQGGQIPDLDGASLRCNCPHAL